MLPNEAIITEVCPRDGFQSLQSFISTEEKITIINKLLECNYKQIEVTSFVHPRAIPQLKDAEYVLKNINRREGTKFRALIPNLKGLERAIDAGVHKVKLMLSATDSHSINNANCTVEEAMEGFEPLVNHSFKNDIEISGSISVAFGCPYEGEVSIERLISICKRYIELGINEVSLADTTGMGNPLKVKKVVRTLNKHFPNMVYSLHLHNTRGMAFAMAVAGLEEGIVSFDSSASGLGGCPYAPNATGNIASEDLIHGFEEMGIKTGIDLDKVIEVSKYISSLFPNQANSFLLSAGKCSDLHIAPTSQKKLG